MAGTAAPWHGSPLCLLLISYQDCKTLASSSRDGPFIRTRITTCCCSLLQARLAARNRRRYNAYSTSSDDDAAEEDDGEEYLTLDGFLAFYRSKAFNKPKVVYKHLRNMGVPVVEIGGAALSSYQDDHMLLCVSS